MLFVMLSHDFLEYTNLFFYSFHKSEDGIDSPGRFSYAKLNQQREGEIKCLIMRFIKV